MNVESEATYENGVLKPDQPLPFGNKQRVRITVHAAGTNGQAVQVRQALARNLIAWLDEIAALVGDVSLATKLQLLKRGLARCHDELKGHPAEAAYLSIVTLVEAALTQLTWKQYTHAQLGVLRKILAEGRRKSPLDFSDVEWARRLLAAQEVPTTPRIDLASLTSEDLADDDTGTD